MAVLSDGVDGVVGMDCMSGRGDMGATGACCCGGGRELNCGGGGCCCCCCWGRMACWFAMGGVGPGWGNGGCC